MLLFAFLLTACAPPVVERKRFFWPPPGYGQPRIEYLNFYQTDEDTRRGVHNWLEEAILGKERPAPLFTRPHDVASDGEGRVFVTDISKRVVFILDLVRHEVRLLQSGKGGPATFRFPYGVALAEDGTTYVVDSGNQEVQVFGADERFRKSFGKEHLARPTGLAVDSARRRLYVVDTDAHRVVVFGTDGTFLRASGSRGDAAGEFSFPLDAAVDSEGNLYVLDSMNARVQVFDPEGNFVRAFGERGTAAGSFQVAKAIAVSPSGHVYVTDSMANRFVVFDLAGKLLLNVGGASPVLAGRVNPGGFYLPQGIDVDANDTIWIVDSLNRLVHEYQYLTEAYLAKHPISADQLYLPPVLQPDAGGAGAK